MKRAAAKPAHSPGPWAIQQRVKRGWFVITADGSEVAGALGLKNALLVSAAPDLLEVLKELDGRLLRCCAAGASASEAYDSFYQDVVQAAINKATGGAA